MNRFITVLIIISSALIILCLCSCNDLGDKAVIILKGIAGGDSTSARVNGTELKYRGKVALKLNFNATELNISESTADMSLTGNANGNVDLQISYFEYKPQDATIYTENGTIKTKSKSGKPVLISRIEGNIPPKLNLNLETGSGDISLFSMQNNAVVNVSTGSGDISINQAKQWKQAVIKTGSGDISFSVNPGTQIIAETGSGDINLTDSRIDNLKTVTGSGDITLTNSQIDTMKAGTGSGDIHLKSSRVAQRDITQGAGELYED